jgi:hypothetical protein
MPLAVCAWIVWRAWAIVAVLGSSTGSEIT